LLEKNEPDRWPHSMSAPSARIFPVVVVVRRVLLLWLVGGLVVSAPGIRARGAGFDSQVVPLFHWVATLGKLFPHIPSPVSQLQETGVQKGSFRRLW